MKCFELEFFGGWFEDFFAQSRTSKQNKDTFLFHHPQSGSKYSVHSQDESKNMWRIKELKFK